jgi:hypothetical protein
LEEADVGRNEISNVKMPVPRRRKKNGAVALLNPLALTKVLDISFVFQKSRMLLLYGFAPSVVLMGMFSEPGPASWFELINIW